MDLKWNTPITKNKINMKFFKSMSDPIGIETKEHYWLSDLLPTDAVTRSLWGKKTFSAVKTATLSENIDVRPEWIRVGRNGKFSIVAYQYRQKKGAKPK